MLLGIGIDILSIARLEGMIARRGADRVAQRICSARELAGFRALGAGNDNASADLSARQLRFLSARWATKEAAFKALPPRTLSGWKDVELTHAQSGRPSLKLVWEARASLAERAGVRAETAKLRAGTSDGGESQRQGNGKTTDINTDDKSSRLPPRIHLLTTISHDAGVLVAAVVAQRALQGGGDEDDVGLDADV